jgi:bifunctional DNA-binding transcriptional regulator/antitoxin component of YhaV-PrlF toxin-antitoxin module
MVTRVSERGQITIDRKIREQLGVRPGMIAYQTVVDGHLEVVFLPAPHHDSLYGALQGLGRAAAPMTRAEIEQAVAEAVAEEQAGRGK